MLQYKYTSKKDKNIYEKEKITKEKQRDLKIQCNNIVSFERNKIGNNNVMCLIII